MATPPTGDTSGTTISDLPPEILIHIFTYLPNHLRVVRLVCSKWNDACNTVEVSGNEKINIDGWNMERVNEFFSGKKFLRNIYNLCLEGLSLRANNIWFFKKYGRTLRSLTLRDCDVSRHAAFLPFCRHLNTLVLEECSPTITQPFRRSGGSFVPTNIVSLSIDYSTYVMWADFSTDNVWTDENMNSCFRICPRLRSLSLCDRSEDAPVSFNCIHDALSTRAAGIVELNLDGIQFTSERIEQFVSIPNLKLRKLSIIDHATLTLRSMFNIVIQQPDLQDIVIERCWKIPVNDSADWIGRCSKLTHLTLRNTRWGSVLDRKLLDALTSRLHLRELKLAGSFDSETRIDENCRGIFEHLRVLELNLKHFDVDCILKKVSTNLNQLHLDKIGGISIKMFEFISNRFTNLETLDFSIDKEDEWASIVEEYTSKQISWNFEKLKNLRIWAKSKVRSSINLLMRFKAPNLQHVALDGFRAITETALSKIIRNFPSLERFEHENFGSTVDPLMLRASIMSDRKMLSFLYLDDVEHLQLHRQDYLES